MSVWTYVDAFLDGVKDDLSGLPTPQGSEGGSPLWRITRTHWVWDAKLRDRGEQDAPEIRDWFLSLCRNCQPREAFLKIDVGPGGRYEFDWDNEHQTLVLEIPPLYREALEEKH